VFYFTQRVKGKNMRKLPLLFLALFTMGAMVSAQDTPQPNGVNLTVYNDGSALVQDTRTFTLTAGENTLNFTDVAATIDPTSVSFNSLTDPEGTSVIEQNYVYDLVDAFTLMNRYIDQTIRVTTLDGTVYEGTLLSSNGGIILRNGNGEVIVVNPSEVRETVFPNLPDGLITRPTLRWQLFSQNGGDQQLELTYLTSGINWTADYILLLNNDSTALDLNGWITLNNNSGTTFNDATLKLIAGDVNRLPQNLGMVADGMVMSRVEQAPADVVQRDFNEYKLYQIPRPVTIGNNETKQIEFVSGANIPTNTFYVYDGSPVYYNYGYLFTDQYYGDTGITTVGNYVEFNTSEENGVGADLPEGRVRVYQEDIDGTALLVGENSINHTPEGETVQFYLGNAFDLVGERIQTDYRLVSDTVVQETYQITLRNRKDDEAVEIRVPEDLWRWSNWEILNSSTDFTQLNSTTIEFRAQVPAQGEVTITYTVQYSYP
jgi:hypothetical protein